MSFDQAKLLETALEIIGSVKCPSLTTLDESGTPKTRTIAAFPPDDDMTIWLGTSPNSRKAVNITADSRITLNYWEPEGMSYVTVNGKAQLVNDPELKKKYWMEGWERWYPEPEKDYILIQIKPESLEIFSFKHEVMGSHPDWIPPTYKFN